MLSLLANSVAGTPYGPGPYGVDKFESKIAGLDAWNLKTWYPMGGAADAKLPVLLMIAGFHSPIAPYSNFFSAVAAHGVVAIGVGWKLAGPLNYTKLAADLTPALGYITGGDLAKDLASKGAQGTPKEDQFILGGHSAGNHAFVRRLVSNGCGAVGGAVMVDPVDGFDPYGMVDEFVIHPPKPVEFATPAVHSIA